MKFASGQRIYILRNGKIPPAAAAEAQAQATSSGPAEPADAPSQRKHRRKHNTNRQQRPCILGVPFCREDFGLLSAPPTTPASTTTTESNTETRAAIPHPVNVDWMPYAIILKGASHRMALVEWISGRKRRRAALKVSMDASWGGRGG